MSPRKQVLAAATTSRRRSTRVAAAAAAALNANAATSSDDEVDEVKTSPKRTAKPRSSRKQGTSTVKKAPSVRRSTRSSVRKTAVPKFEEKVEEEVEEEKGFAKEDHPESAINSDHENSENEEKIMKQTIVQNGIASIPASIPASSAVKSPCHEEKEEPTATTGDYCVDETPDKRSAAHVLPIKGQNLKLKTSRATRIEDSVPYGHEATSEQAQHTSKSKTVAQQSRNPDRKKENIVTSSPKVVKSSPVSPPNRKRDIDTSEVVENKEKKSEENSLMIVHDFDTKKKPFPVDVEDKQQAPVLTKSSESESSKQQISPADIILPRKRSLSKDRTDQPTDQKSRRISVEKPTEQARNQRFFGFIKTTLHQASEEQAQLSDTIKKRQKILSTASERVNREQGGRTKYDHEGKRVCEDQENKRRLESLALIKAQAALSRRKFLEEVGYDEDANKYLLTNTQPGLYWKPKIENEATKRALEEQVALREQRGRVIVNTLKQRLEEEKEKITFGAGAEAEPEAEAEAEAEVDKDTNGVGNVDENRDVDMEEERKGGFKVRV